MEMLGKVRRMRYRDGLSRAEIARRTGLSRTTVKKWLRVGEAVLPRYRRAAVLGKIGAVQRGAGKPPGGRCTASEAGTANRQSVVGYTCISCGK
jgi:transcriptional regulator with XRE-family HTH domain